ncbi:PadR family transcriptional regulator [Chengkuizengella axinellae]|uniref:Helix-turn-helix transcriptional regulator n=1 Tax=Chengkuizengella axinellae TaxID=3064388 RepID=A0ABT9IZG1_9BACL|nr:helix-turn-helix transcriptional regulator [Chengkuizengella sp. 2205SS18-9]MDP5274170.1 helix-turn-helix transcriptional regulator [Chengkuizengella sp. 2205SS18-9]
MDKEIMKGSIDILLLSLVIKKDMYGYEMVKTLKENSQDLYQMSEGTLYPALKRLEKKNWIQSYWGDSESGGRRKYYRIKEDGKKELDRKLSEWKKVNHLIKVNTEGLSWIKALKPI